jgi:hypothetical protein
MFKNIGMHNRLEVRDARSSTFDISPRPIGPRFREIAIMVAVDNAIVGSCKTILAKNEMVFLVSDNST